MLDFAGLVEVEHASISYSNLRQGLQIWLSGQGDFLSMTFILSFLEDHSLF